MSTLSAVFAAAGLLALSYCAVVYVSARRFQARETRRFVGERRAEPANSASQPKPPAPRERLRLETGSVIAMLSIPRLGLSTIVVEGAEEHELKLGAGHIRGTSLPGNGGNVGIAGHRDTVFRPLRSIRADDTIKVMTEEREHEYKVVSTEIVGPDDIQVLYPTVHETLTLVTCYPFEFVGRAPRRFIVRADCADCDR